MAEPMTQKDRMDIADAGNQVIIAIDRLRVVKGTEGCVLHLEDAYRRLIRLFRKYPPTGFKTKR
jgi:hypothetical protein